MAAPVVAAEPVWATLLAAKESFWGAIFELQDTLQVICMGQGNPQLS